MIPALGFIFKALCGSCWLSSCTHPHVLCLPSSFQAISRGVTKAGVGVNTLNLELVSLDEVSSVIKESDGFVLGKSNASHH